ncbi:thymidylate synthase [Escherichia phage vB_EcoP_PAS59]|uniref:Thymidylate synthase n=1 Tax=Escherichia phage vB_EcoP_PAS59 TaxID=3053873 RepID=A0AA51VIP3_9CAUD|nr:thymidylate synthase [Escherichia phage vB_EcoP_PAS59]
MTIKASLIDNFGSDLTVVNAARVTMGVEREELKESDTRLINFLARERHVSPFRHPQASFRCEAPIAIARQLQKHQVGFSWNEMSRRYKDGAVDIFIPKEIFSRPDDLHSGSGILLEGEEEAKALALFNSAYEASLASYDELIKFVAPEQARFVLPQGMVTTWYWTGSLYGWFELCRQRLSSHAQYEVRLFAQSLDEEMAKLYPISWAALKKTLES